MEWNLIVRGKSVFLARAYVARYFLLISVHKITDAKFSSQFNDNLNASVTLLENNGFRFTDKGYHLCYASITEAGVIAMKYKTEKNVANTEFDILVVYFNKYAKYIRLKFLVNEMCRR